MSSPLTSEPTNTVGYETNISYKNQLPGTTPTEVIIVDKNRKARAVYDFIAPKAKAGKEYLSQKLGNYKKRQYKNSQVYPLVFVLFLFYTIMSIAIWFDWVGMNENGESTTASLVLGLLFSILSVIFGVFLIYMTKPTNFEYTY